MSDEWTVEQQQALDNALNTYPDTIERRERWRRISRMVPGKNMKDCISRAKYLSEKIAESSKEDNKNENSTMSNKQVVESTKNKKLSPLEIITPYLENMDESYKDYLINTIEEFNDYEEFVDIDTIRAMLEPFFEDSDLLETISQNMTIAVNDIVKSKGDVRDVKVLDSEVVMNDQENTDDNVHETLEETETNADDDTIDWKINWEDHESSDMTIIRERGRGPVGRNKNIDIKSVDVSILGEYLLMNATLRLHDGYHYGLVGRNGVGKTTLLRRMANYAIHGFPDYLLVLHVTQEIEGTDLSVLDSVLQSDVEAQKLMKEESQLMAELEDDKTSTSRAEEIVKELQKVGDKRSLLNIDSAKGRAISILEGLGFNTKKQAMKTKELSGGWRMRVALACALFIKPDILLLDEPTNHLDLPAVFWLQSYLQSYQGTVIVVSHDRVFLNYVAQEIIEFTHKQLRYWTGNYDTFVKAKEEKRKMIQQKQEELDERREHVKEQIQKMQKIASKDKSGGQKNMIKSRQKKYNSMGFEKDLEGRKWLAQASSYKHGISTIRIGAVNANDGGWSNGKRTASSLIERDDPPIKFPVPICPLVTYQGPMIRLNNVTFSYEPITAERPALLQNMELTIDLHTKLTLLGPNGIGKSTLIKLLMGELQPLSGKIDRYHNLNVGYFAQHHMDALNLNISALTHISRMDTTLKDHEIRQYLGSYGITGSLATKPMGTLSGGQKSRVILASLCFTRPHLIILDEPTNHLDMDSIEALSVFLKEYKGGIVLVTHDQYLVEQLESDLYIIKPGGLLEPYEGKFEEYREFATKFEEDYNNRY